MVEKEELTASAKAKTVFIVEDENSIAMLLRFLVEREGFHVEHAVDGRIAQEMIATLTPPALVLLDIMLPYADGYELLSIIRRQANWKNVPVVMLTSKGSERDIARALDSGADDYMVKPFQPDELRARMRRLMRGSP